MIVVLVASLIFSLSGHRVHASHVAQAYLSSGSNNAVKFHNETTFGYGGINFGWRAVTSVNALSGGNLYFNSAQGDLGYPYSSGQYGWWAQYFLYDEGGMIYQVTFVWCHPINTTEYYGISQPSGGYGGSFYATSERTVRISDDSSGCSNLAFEPKATYETVFVW